MGPHTTRKLTAGEERTLIELKRDAELLGDPHVAAACERGLAGWADDADFALGFALELHGCIDGDD